MPKQRIGIYIDSENITRNGGYAMRYGALRRFAERDGGSIVRFNSYMAMDVERGKTDREYREKVSSYHWALRDIGCKVIEKPVKWFTNDKGLPVSKANADLDLAVDLMLQSDRLDSVLLLSGDGDFLQVVRAVQNKGCQVECLAFQNFSADLQKEVDVFHQGYLVPGLVAPISNQAGTQEWGEVGSRMRGVVVNWNNEKRFGFVRYMRTISGKLWITDTRDEDSCYSNAFFHASSLPLNFDSRKLPSRDLVFEFLLKPSKSNPGEMTAEQMSLVTPQRNGRETAMIENG